MFCENHAQVDMSNRDSMITFLKNHFRYNTMNAWNQSTSYANNVKIHNLNIPKESEDLAYQIVYGEIDAFEYEFDVNITLNDFMTRTGYAIGFNGRSGGYLVLYDTELDKDGSYSVMPGRSIDMYEDFSDWDMQELKERTKLIMDFDRTCEQVYELFLNTLENSVIIEQEVITTNTVRALVSKENADELKTEPKNESADDRIKVILSLYEEDAKSHCEDEFPDEQFDNNDYAVLAERYLKKHDCNIPDNDQWSYIISEYIEERQN